MSFRNGPRNGFAVLELLVALALLGVIASFVAGSLAFGSRVWERASEASETGRRLSELSFLRTQLTHALIFETGSGSRSAFDGRRSHVSLVTLRGTPGYGAAQPWTLSFSLIPGTDHLTVGLAPRFTGPATASERRILEGLSAFAVRYHGRPLDQDRAGWYETWEDQPHLPDLIEVSLTFDDGGTPIHHRMSVHPKVH